MELSAKRDITADQLRDLTQDGGIFNTNIVAGMGEHSCAKLFDFKADVKPADDDDDTKPDDAAGGASTPAQVRPQSNQEKA
eukprot:5043835-Pyramimonas_sp.AAC.1